MIKRPLVPLLAALLALAQLSCAAANLTPLRDSMPAARAALLPEYRLFYDALQDEGDWVLIEPYGYVFRPRVNFVAWRPYQNGFWAPSDVYGWVWVSTESFGWVTFHYGDWTYDRFQGWVWLPGVDWGPAWVSWAQDGGYIGWAPRMPTESAYSLVPGGAYTYVNASQLAATDLSSRTHTEAQLGGAVAAAKPILNMVEHDGVTFNRGPKISEIEMVAGPLRRVEIEEVTPAAAPVPVAEGEPALKRREATPAPRERESDAVGITRRAAAEAAREAKAIAESGARTPARFPLMRPAPARAPAPEPARKEPRERSGGRKRAGGTAPAAPADSTH